MIKSVLVATSMLTFAYGHAVITAVAGDNGVTTSGFGVSEYIASVSILGVLIDLPLKQLTAVCLEMVRRSSLSN